MGVEPVIVYETHMGLTKYYRSFTCTWDLRDDPTKDDMALAINAARRLNCPSFFGLYLAVPVSFLGGEHGNA